VAVDDIMEDWKLEPARDLGLPHQQRTRSLSRESGLIESVLHRIWRSGMRGYFAVWHRLAVSGAQNFPVHPPFVCVSNHASHLDAPAVACALPGRWCDRVFPIAAGDTFFSKRTTATFSAFVMNALPLWRRNCGSHSIQLLREKLMNEASIYILFPEGTRSRTGTMAAFKPGLGMLVAGTNVPVVPCRIEGSFQAFPPAHRLPRPGRIRISVGCPISFASTANDRKGWMEIASIARKEVERL